MSKPIKLFADGADIGKMYELYSKRIVSGFTTNPTLMRKAGVVNYEEFAKQAIRLMSDMPISFEVFSDNLKEMERQARILSDLGKNVYIKIPITNTMGFSTNQLITDLSDSGIKINVTAILTFEQVKSIVETISDKTPSIISVFAGRIADTGIDPTTIMRMSSKILKQNKNNKTELLWASTRELFNIIQAESCDCDIITVTPDILKKLPMLGKDLTKLSLETVTMFYEDAKSAGYKI